MEGGSSQKGPDPPRLRQIGKTYSIRDFISTKYEWSMEFNLEERKDIAQLFKNKDLTVREATLRPFGKCGLFI